MNSSYKSADVPCGSCNLCCRGDSIRLLPEDNPDLYQTVKHEPSGGLMLDHKENGDCIYLDRKTGCTIHDHSPTLCRIFDCRGLFKSIPFSQVNVLDEKGYLDKEIWHRGKELSLKLKKQNRRKRKK